MKREASTKEDAMVVSDRAIRKAGTRVVEKPTKRVPKPQVEDVAK